jgi:hypothetical protein
VRDFFAENKIDWGLVERFEKEANLSGYAMALAECDKLMNFLLVQEGFGGINTSDRVKNARDRFANVNELFGAIETKANVFEKYDRGVSIQELKDSIKIYKESINDLVQGQIKESSTWEKFVSYVQVTYLNKPQTGVNFLLSLSSLVILVLVLDSTHFGRSFVQLLAQIFRSVLPLAIIILILAGILLALVIAGLFYSTRKKSIRAQVDRLYKSLSRRSVKRNASGNQTRINKT